jgi:hypothetical protein
MSSGDDSSANKTATKYAQSAIPPYSEIKKNKDGGQFLSSPDTGLNV